MKLILSTWMEVQAYLRQTDGILIPPDPLSNMGQWD